MTNEPLDDVSRKAAEARREVFAKNVRKYLTLRGYNQSDLARRASDFMPEGKTISKQTISHFVKGANIPSSRTMVALAKALNVKPSDLDPAPDTSWLDIEMRKTSFESAETVEPPMLTVDSLNGQATLNIKAKVPVEKALKIIELLKSDN